MRDVEAARQAEPRNMNYIEGAREMKEKLDQVCFFLFLKKLLVFQMIQLFLCIYNKITVQFRSNSRRRVGTI